MGIVKANTTELLPHSTDIGDDDAGRGLKTCQQVGRVAIGPEGK